MQHSDNYVDEAGSVALGEAMMVNTTLTKLDLNSEVIIDHFNRKTKMRVLSVQITT